MYGVLEPLHLLYWIVIRVSHYSVNGLSGHHSLSPYQLIKYLINYPIKNLIVVLLNLITNQSKLTIDK